MYKKYLSLIFLCGFVVSTIKSQELNCTVTVNSEKIEGTDKTQFTELQTSISNFLNQTQFTGMTVLQKEKIDCSMLIIVKSITQDILSCEMILQSKRPVFNSSYSTTVLNYKDEKFNFQYQKGDRIEFKLNTSSYKNLEALLIYYAYLIIGYDADSFEKLGGTKFFQTCENIVTIMQTSTLDKAELVGWNTLNGNRNRYIVINNLLDDAMKSFRIFCYTYHRLGLDEMVNSVTKARSRINQDLDVLKEAYRARVSSYLVNMFLDAKIDEIVNLYSKATTQEKQNAYDILTNIDPTREAEYKKITN